MPRFRLDDVEYNSEDLSELGRAQLASLQFVEIQLRKLNEELAVYKLAHKSCVVALRNELDGGDVPESLRASTQPSSSDSTFFEVKE